MSDDLGTGDPPALGGGAHVVVMEVGEEDTSDVAILATSPVDRLEDPRDAPTGPVSTTVTPSVPESNHR